MRSSVLTLRIGLIVKVVIQRSIERHCIYVSSGKDGLVACGLPNRELLFQTGFPFENQIRTLLK